MEKTFDVLTIGNAIVDILARAEDDLLVSIGLTKGMMRLIDAEEAERLYTLMGPAVEASGGSASNTAAGIASLGGRAAYIGKVAKDDFGRIFRHDITRSGVHFATPPLERGAPTARSMILITPDGERTMNTYLGACQMLSPEDIEPEVVAGARITYLEGYLWDRPAAKDAFRRAAAIAHQQGRQVAITLSDSFCVDRWREEFLGLIRNKVVDIVFANREEVRSLYTTADLDTAVAALRQECGLAVVTMGEEGALAARNGEIAHVAAFAPESIEDLTGAGDQFAAGFLLGLTRELPLDQAVALGCLAGMEVIGHIGPRPQRSLKALAEERGLALFPLEERASTREARG